ncbi:MAG: ArsR family transcriptional regulator [Propionivibrio sp.]|jgi:predicted transcriptional regulator|uniref:ArsR/SmtB family transcription factor n=1 Tax=Propionivibrio sp. TaxID=2212460 RepID=UPI001B78AD43|nr:ArsR family transcriptional regulator [Propionivibrio sp.]MBP7204372.1 ArsR family transcriptional regulator [Propionivibrio sp.]
MIVAGNKTLFMDGEQGIKVMQALGNETRLLMLSLLSHRTLNLSALAEAINLPQSTTAFHLKQLEGAGLVNVQYLPGTRGQQKLISKRYDEVHFKLPGVAIESASNVVEVSMPVGNYKRIAVKPTCGIATDTKYIGMIDDVRSFYEPEHVFAQILWFKQGFVEYDFPNNIPYGSQATELQFSMEICSEAPEYDLDWPSDITLSVNGVETGIWTSQGDFGGVRGRLTPEWWPIEQTQYGVLKRWRITMDGTYVDGEKISEVSLDNINLEANPHICMRLEVKEDARNVGGINLFGKRFGNYNQDLVMRTHYEFRDGERPYALK